MGLPGQVKTSLAVSFQEELTFLAPGPEFQDQRPRSHLGDAVDSAVGQLAVKFSRHGLKDYAVHGRSLVQVTAELQGVSCWRCESAKTVSRSVNWHLSD
jgi:hypothetical protein